MLPPIAIAVLSEPDFHGLKTQRSTLRLPDRFHDWLDEREGLMIGLSAAGVRAILIIVDLDKFLAWCATNAITIDETALDRFAASMQRGATVRADFALPAERYAHVVQHRFESFN